MHGKAQLLSQNTKELFLSASRLWLISSAAFTRKYCVSKGGHALSSDGSMTVTAVAGWHHWRHTLQMTLHIGLRVPDKVCGSRKTWCVCRLQSIKQS
jgi:hypothetical protein